MSKLSLSLKIIVTVTALLLISLISSGISIVSMQGAKTRAQDISEKATPLNISSMGLLRAMSDTIIYFNRYVAFESDDDFNFAYANVDEIIKYLDDTNATLAKVDNRDFDELKKRTDSSVEQLKKYKEKMTEISALLHEISAQERQLRAENIAATESIHDFNESMLDDLTTADKARLARMAKLISNNTQILSLNEKALAAVSEAIRSREAQNMAAIAPMIEDILAKLSDSKKISQVQSNIISLNLVGENFDKAIATAGRITQLMETFTATRNEQAAIQEDTLETAKLLSTLVADSTEVATSDLYSTLSRAATLVGACALIVLVIGVLSILILNSQVIRKVKNFVRAMENFTSGDGDLTKRIKVDTKDELGQLGTSINSFVENIQEIVNQVKTASDDVASGNTELAATMEELSTTFNSQSEQVTSVAENMHSINETSRQVVLSLAENISKMNEADGSIQRGNKLLQEVENTMLGIKNQTAALGETINNLADSSVKIGDILSVINDIADQTNLLALNAAIEAARAGDAGRGFAVVADEVRKLAERTQSSISEISTIINTLQKDSNMASEEMKKTAVSVDGGVESIRSTGAIISTVVEAVQEVEHSSSNVNGDVNRQFEMVQTVSDNTQAIAAGIEESVQVVTEVSGTVSHLQKQADMLKGIVSKFKV